MNNISVILNVYKRPYTLEKQIESILNQTIKIEPENIHIWYNYSGVNQSKPNNNKIKTYQCNWNTKFFGRFTIPMLCNTEYIAMFDDDIIPGVKWLENCLNTMNKVGGLLGCSGVIFQQKKYHPFSKVGWNGLHSPDVHEVDLVGHSWFYKQEWIKYFWSEKPVSWDNGEDIMFSYLLKKNGIKTYVPAHPENNFDIWGNHPNLHNNWGSDSNASWITNKNHYNERNNIVSTLINKGWKTVRNV